MIRAALFIGLVWFVLNVLGLAPLFHFGGDADAIGFIGAAGLLVVAIVTVMVMVGVSVLGVVASIVAIPLLVIGLTLLIALSPLWLPLLALALLLKCLLSTFGGSNYEAWR